MRKKKELVLLSEEDKAFAEDLYEKHKKTIYYTARQVTDDRQLAEDLSQDCWVRLMKNISSIRRMDCCKIDAYIVITVRRLYINHAKKESRLTLLPIDQPSVAMRADEKTAELEQEQEKTRLSLEEILNQLSERDGLILQSKYILGMSDEELAAVFDCSPNSVRTLVYRARKRANTIGVQSEKGDEKEHG